MSVLGELVVDPGSETIVCRTPSPASRRRAAALIRAVVPGSRLDVDGTSLVLDLSTLVALRSRRDIGQLHWSEEAEKFVDTLAANYSNASRARLRLQELQQGESAALALADYPLRENLDGHQVVAVASMADPAIHGICLFDEQGAGKTVMAIHAYDRLRQLNEADVLLVFAPKNMLGEWKKDFLRFMGDRYAVKIVAGSRGEKYDSLFSNADAYITNYETAHLLEQPMRSFLSRYRGRVVLAADESFFVKNRATKRATAVRRLRHYCHRCWVLCGTPAPNNALDVVHQFDVADGGVTFAGVDLPKDPQALWQTIKETVEQRGVYLRRLKRDVLPELPQKNFERVLVPMEEIQAQMYADTLRTLVADVESVDDLDFSKHLTSFMGRRMALFEICSHPGQVAPQYRQVPGKLVALDGLLGELIDRQGEKVVLWSFFRYSLDHIFQRYQKFSPVRLDGTVSDPDERAEAIRRFQEDNETMLFVGNPAAGGTGITLTRSRIAVYESFSIQAAHYLQSVDRIHRRGQSRETLYYVLLCKDSIEEDEYDRLLGKERLSLELFGDNAPEAMTREVFLKELLQALRRL